MRYPVRAPERGPRSQTHAQRRNLGISVRPGHPAPAATLPAIPAAAPSGAQDYRWSVRDPLGLTPPGYDWRPIRGWTRLLHEREMKADSMPERLLIGPGSPPSIDPVYPELSPPLEPCRKMTQKEGKMATFAGTCYVTAYDATPLLPRGYVNCRRKERRETTSHNHLFIKNLRRKHGFPNFQKSPKT